jgi:hypothetical protein
MLFSVSFFKIMSFAIIASNKTDTVSSKSVPRGKLLFEQFFPSNYLFE